MLKYKAGLLIIASLSLLISLFPPYWCNRQFKKYDFIFLQNSRIVKGDNYSFEIKTYYDNKPQLDRSDLISIKLIRQGQDSTYEDDRTKSHLERIGSYTWVSYERNLVIKPYKIYSITKPAWYRLNRELIVNELIIEYLGVFFLGIVIQLLLLRRKQYEIK